jgi:hypothetical protein
VIALLLTAWGGASCSRRSLEAAPDAQAVMVERTTSAESRNAAPPIASKTVSNESEPVDAGPCIPTALSDSSRLVSDVLPCDGACPVYKVTLHGDGSVEYDGTIGKITGHRVSKIARKATEALFAQAECGTFAVPRQVPHGVGSGMAGPAEAIVTLDVGKGPRNLRAQRVRSCTASLDPQDHAVCELSYAIDEAVHVEAWVGYLPRNGHPKLARDRSP